jgi:hypothetical protein
MIVLPLISEGVYGEFIVRPLRAIHLWSRAALGVQVRVLPIPVNSLIIPC